jgi:murein DD-endopeptidase MepM/ murein hydrolase activator NlpD
LLLGGVSLALVALLGFAFAAGVRLGESSGLKSAGGNPGDWARAVATQQQDLAQMRMQVQSRIDALAARMGQVNAHVLRIDALGKRLTEMANIDSREFDFDTAPAVGGPEDEGVGAELPDLSRMLESLEERVNLRGVQLAALENVILQRELREQIVPDGRPVRRGFLSSYFGERQDPMTGHQSFHRGVDFAGSAGAEVIAVASGVVTFSGERAGFGKIVEVSHGAGLVTRYAHNQRNVVSVGETVTRGDTLALMGSTGRSTGPHVHFEVIKNGHQVNPLSFIGR